MATDQAEVEPEPVATAAGTGKGASVSPCVNQAQAPVCGFPICSMVLFFFSPSGMALGKGGLLTSLFTKLLT